MKKSKVFIACDCFYPGFRSGGPVVSLMNLVSVLSRDSEILVYTRDYDLFPHHKYDDVQSDVVTSRDGFDVIYASSINFSKIRSAMLSFDPDVVYLNSFFSPFVFAVLLSARWFTDVRVIVAPRGELQRNALAMKPIKKSLFLYFYRSIFRARDMNFHVTGLDELADVQTIFSESTFFDIANIPTNLPFIRRTKKSHDLKIIFFSRISRKKNLDYAVKIVNEAKLPVCFDIYGAVEDEEYWEGVLRDIKVESTAAKISYRGVIMGENLASTLSGYHALLLPTRSENYGHVIAESLQTGLVPIISDQTPWKPLEEHGAGWSRPLDRPEEFIAAVCTMYHMSQKDFDSMSLNARKFFENELDGSGTVASYREMFR